MQHKYALTLSLVSLALFAACSTKVLAEPNVSTVPQEEKAKWIGGIGGGARIGIGEPTFGMVYGRLGHELNKNVSLSLRPAYVFGNSDGQGTRNNQGAFQMPLTLDIQPNAKVSPYIGAGIATNTDSNGNTQAMVSAGVDISVAKHISLVAGLNYIIQSSDSDGRDLEALTALYFRF